MFETIERIFIAVKDLDSSLKFFTDLLDVEFDVVGANDDLKIRGAYSPSGLELIEPTADDSFLIKYLQKKGEGVVGIVLKVRDMDSAVKRLEEKGLKKTMDMRVGKMREVGFNPHDTHGVQIVLAEYPAKHPATIAAWSVDGPEKK